MKIVDQVRTTILRHRLLERGATVVLGLSGGPDSLALTHVLLELAPEFEVQLHLAHLNHELRGIESAEDAAFVEKAARELNLPATVQGRDVPEFARAHHLSSEEAARIVRYRFFRETAERVGARTIAVAHNADDQVETVLMHLLRGAGLAGLRGMTYRSELQITQADLTSPSKHLVLIRPFLDVSRTEIEAYCLERSLKPRFDQSNIDVTLFRNRLRHQVLPYLEQLNPNLRHVLHNSALAIADDYEQLHRHMEDAFLLVARQVEGAYVFDRDKWRALGTSMQRATLREAVSRLRRSLRNINWQHIEDARLVALEKPVGAEATLPQGLLLIVGYDEFTVGEEAPMPDIPLLHRGPVALQFGGNTLLPESEWAVHVSEINDESAPQSGPWVADFDLDRITGPLVLRERRAGERFEPGGLSGRHQSLRKFMIDAKIPRHVRDQLPIMADDEKVLWVCGYRVDERSMVTLATGRIIRVEFLKETA